MKTRPKLKSIDTASPEHNFSADRPDNGQACVAIEDQLMTLHHCSLRVRGVLHLLQESMQSRGSIDRSNADAICALISAAEKDIRDMDDAIEKLTEKHLETLRNSG
jgi:hypothetical protein